MWRVVFGQPQMGWESNLSGIEGPVLQSLNIDGDLYQNWRMLQVAEKPVVGGWCEAWVTGLKAEDG